MIDNPTGGGRCTLGSNKTRIQTLVLNTGLGSVTISVDVTFNFFTQFIGIANKALWTLTSGCMIVS